MSDVIKLFRKTKGKPTVAQIKKAEAGERAEGVEKALEAGKGNVVTGAKKLRMKHPGLSAAEKAVDRAMKPTKKK